MTWPPQSPDLDPIEMVWGELDHRVKAKGPTSAKHLWELLQDCWKTIPGDYLLKLIKRMPRVCKAVIKAKVSSHGTKMAANNCIHGVKQPSLQTASPLDPDHLLCQCHYPVPRVSLSCTPSVAVIILYPECQCHPVPRVSVSLSCTPSVSVIILYPRVSASLSCTPSVSVIILYPECQCHYPVPPVVSVIILYPECQCHYPVPPVSVSLSCTPSVSVIILYPQCQCHYPVPPVSVSLSCTPSVSVIILYPECQCHYPVPRVSVSLSCPPSDPRVDTHLGIRRGDRKDGRGKRGRRKEGRKAQESHRRLQVLRRKEEVWEKERIRAGRERVKEEIENSDKTTGGRDGDDEG
ncbi:unnamed protein product [Ranitomeya imitator]|uniref:Transposase n=1 Tax=Ranitomeya imitator TaxID=111125 RepID=A0ABN9L2F8_9NEOB|nr:unnamed protein product [Ranitomeya imitator]